MKKVRIKLIVLSKKYIDILNDKEVLFSDNYAERANLLVVKLFFHNEKYTFAIPWRSNVPNNRDLEKFIYKLPATSKTRKYHTACLDYRKMCPITERSKTLYRKYHLSNFSNDMVTVLFIEKNLSEIIKKAQFYLISYENNKIPSNIYGMVNLERALKNLKRSGY